jgi:hypothetical protein
LNKILRHLYFLTLVAFSFKHGKKQCSKKMNQIIFIYIVYTILFVRKQKISFTIHTFSVLFSQFFFLIKEKYRQPSNSQFLKSMWEQYVYKSCYTRCYIYFRFLCVCEKNTDSFEILIIFENSNEKQNKSKIKMSIVIQ